MEILICAASGIETKACRIGLQAAGISKPFKILKTGIGLEKAEKSLNQYLNQGNNPDLIISTGFAGAVTRDLPLYSWVIAEQVFSSKGETTNLNPLIDIPDASRSSIVSLPHLYSPNKSGQLPQSLPDQRLAVDMETAALTKIAGHHKIPILALRLITDTPEEPLSQLMYRIEEGYQAKGRLRVGRVVLDILRDIPEAGEMYREIKTCAKLLSEGWGKYAFDILAQVH